MVKVKRAPYEHQIKELEKIGKTKFDEEHNIYAVLEVAEVLIRWKKDNREYQEIDILNPGMVLYPRPRRLSKWEREKWSLLSPAELEALEVNLKWNLVKIGMRFPDLWGAIRQRGRHIVDNLTERKIRIDREVEVIIAGEAKRMKDSALMLSSFTNRFLITEKITPQLRKSFSEEVFPIYQELEGAKNEFKAKAAQLLKQAMEERLIEIPAKLAEAAAKILNRWVEVLDIVESSLRQAENWLSLCKEIEMKVSWTYKRLAELDKKLQNLSTPGKSLLPAQLLLIANEIEGIRIYLNREVLFNPYYQRVWASEVQNLAKAKKYAEAGKDKSIHNLINRALAKLQAIVLKEKPTFAEIRRRRKALPKG